MNKENSSSLSVTTIKKYEEILERLEKNKIYFAKEESVNAILEKINNIEKKNNIKKIQDTTTKLYLCAILWKIKQSSDIENTLLFPINDISAKIKEILLKINEFSSNNLLSEREKIKYLEWTEILKVHDILKSLHEVSYISFTNYVIISMYVLFPPRRLLDYSQMYVHDTETECIDETKNYYINNTIGQLNFNIYKTVKKYKKQSFQVPVNLDKIIKKYISKYNIIGSLFKLTNPHFHERVKKIFDVFAKKKASVSIIRHSFLSFKIFLDLNERNKISYKMAHSLEMQLSYVKKTDQEEKKINPDIMKNTIYTNE